MRLLAASGLAISVVGAALDFLSAYQMIYNTNSMMESSNQFLMGAGLLVLGLAVAGTGLAIARPRTGSRTGIPGLLMEVYGVLMGLASTFAPGMNTTVADAMLVVGVAMFLNGLLMQRRGQKTSTM